IECGNARIKERDMAMYAVFGATGNTGRATVRELQALGEDPPCIVRNPEKGREVPGCQARTAVAEITDRPAMEKALKGIKRVFVVTGHNPQAGEQQINIPAGPKAGGGGGLFQGSRGGGGG